MSTYTHSAQSPIRFPDAGSTSVMTRRAWWLVALNFLVPGAPQVLAGNRKLGRFGLGCTLVLWTLAVLALAVWLIAPNVLLSVAANSITLWVAAAFLVFYAVVWLILSLDTLRLVRLVRTKASARGWIAGLTTVLMFALSGTAAYGAYIATTTSSFLSSVFIAGPSEDPVDGRYNILLLGADTGADREGTRPDSISVVSIDAETGQAVTIGLPRDMKYFPFPEGSPLAAVYPEGYGAIDGCEVGEPDGCQLNWVYSEVDLVSPEMYPDATKQGSEPGVEGMRSAAEGITGLTIQYYALVDMQGFSDLIDALGGVTIDVPSDVPMHSDETFTTVAEWIYAGPQHLDGYHALWYARSRHDTSDYDRMARQRQLQDAVLKQFNPANVLSKFQEIAKAGTKVVNTDIPQSMLGYFTQLAMKTKELPMVNVELVPDNGVDPLDPDFDYIRELINEALYPPVSTEEPAPAD
ncbi:LCP family protein [Microterricola viridarii]|uniref:Cell envelope-related function transcriptional attenuator common domain-containing protein n=1 Tax=Microterricola viridarii TaxID=412690 RepID=A0A1H1QW15_9MICO|nr:LCP family protein [Microterricola viridarii]SDS27555.1 cell envelope-related function transcriptional attenuator common domain-containing protein [Microterricola viridarii]